MNPGLALCKALDPGGVEGGRRGGQQRLLNGWGEAAVVALSQGLLTKIERSPAHVGARRSHLFLVGMLPWQPLGCCYLGGPLVTGIWRHLRHGARFAPDSQPPRCLLLDPWGPQRHPPALLWPHRCFVPGSGFSHIYMLLSYGAHLTLNYYLKALRAFTKLCKSPLCNSELYSHPKRRPLSTPLPHSRSPWQFSRFLCLCICLVDISSR